MVNYDVPTESGGDLGTDNEREYVSGPLVDAMLNNPLPYISKSRVTTWVKCPRSFFYKYVMGKRPEPTEPMLRGTRVHLTFERFYENAREHYDETGELHDDLSLYLPDGPETGLWLDWVDPYIYHFLAFENRRLRAVRGHSEDVTKWFPVSIEEAGELLDPPVEGAPRFMGYADAIYHAVSFPDIEENEGVVVVDFKTGKTPDAKYWKEGILLELEFYTMLFEDKYDVTAVAGYYPKGHDVITAKPNPEIREFICDTVGDMLAAMDTGRFPINENPLCAWRPYKEGENTRCEFYGICASRWATTDGPGPAFYDNEKNPIK